jgi:hypothetical protein
MRGNRRTLLLILLLLLACGAFYVVRHETYTAEDSSQPQTTASQSPSPTSTPRSSIPDFAHIFVIVDEAQSFNKIVNNGNAPYLNRLIKQYGLATNYYATDHPSLPNYLELTSGTNAGITTNCSPSTVQCEAGVRNIADEIEQSGRTWKEYAESAPNTCATESTSKYTAQHNPFVYYADIANSISRCNTHVVSFSQLAIDLRSTDATPDYAFITPNTCDDMDSCSVSDGDTWLSQNVPTILKSAAFTKQNSILFITWSDDGSGSNHVATIIAGQKVKSGYQSAQYYTHYSLLHTIEIAWGLKPLTNNDQKAAIMSDFFQ